MIKIFIEAIKLCDECLLDTSSNFVFLETCFDGVWNQGERGIDCGGPCPPGGKLNLIKLFHANCQKTKKD